MTSPNRRSTADLQRILDGLIGTSGSIRCGDLPEGESCLLHLIIFHANSSVLIKYEIENDAIILEPSEYEGLRTLCLQSPELELDSKDIFSFLRYVTIFSTRLYLRLIADVTASFPSTNLNNQAISLIPYRCH